MLTSPALILALYGASVLVVPPYLELHLSVGQHRAVDDLSVFHWPVVLLAWVPHPNGICCSRHEPAGSETRWWLVGPGWWVVCSRLLGCSRCAVRFWCGRWGWVEPGCTRSRSGIWLRSGVWSVSFLALLIVIIMTLLAFIASTSTSAGRSEGVRSRLSIFERGGGLPIVDAVI